MVDHYATGLGRAGVTQEKGSLAPGRMFRRDKLNQAWGVDFVLDQLHDDMRFCALAILNVYTRGGVAIEAARA